MISKLFQDSIWDYPSATSNSIITVKPTMVAIVTPSMHFGSLCDSGISSSTTTKIIAPAAKHKAYGRILRILITKTAPKTPAIGSTTPESCP